MRIDGKTLFQRAVCIAVQAHQDQADKSGVPYILHPMTVAGRCKTNDERIVAVLHDVVEDTPWTLDQLSELFPESIVQAVDAITHRKNEPYKEYLERVVANRIARVVKFQDVMHNMERMSFIKDEDTKKRLIQKYDHAMNVLSDFMPV